MRTLIIRHYGEIPDNYEIARLLAYTKWTKGLFLVLFRKNRIYFRFFVVSKGIKNCFWEINMLCESESSRHKRMKKKGEHHVLQSGNQ